MWRSVRAARLGLQQGVWHAGGCPQPVDWFGSAGVGRCSSRRCGPGRASRVVSAEGPYVLRGGCLCPRNCRASPDRARTRSGAGSESPRGEHPAPEHPVRGVAGGFPTQGLDRNGARGRCAWIWPPDLGILRRAALVAGRPRDRHRRSTEIATWLETPRGVLADRVCADDPGGEIPCIRRRDRSRVTTAGA